MNKLTDALTLYEQEKLIQEGIDFSRSEFLGSGKNRSVYSAQMKYNPSSGRRISTHYPIIVSVPHENPDYVSANAEKNRIKGDASIHETEVLNRLGVEEARSIAGEGRTINISPWPAEANLETIIKKHGPLSKMHDSRLIIMGLIGELQKLRMAGMLHRDIKPDNVLVDWDYGYVGKLGDYELAGSIDDMAESSLPTRGTGTYAHRSLLNAWATGRPAKATEKTEIYSLGATLYEMFTGKKPSNYKIAEDSQGREIEVNGSKKKIALFAEQAEGEKRLDYIRDAEEEKRIKAMAKEVPRWVRPFVYGCLTDRPFYSINTFDELSGEFGQAIKREERIKELVHFLPSGTAMACGIAALYGVAHFVAPHTNPEYNQAKPLIHYTSGTSEQSAHHKLTQMGHAYLDSKMNRPINGEDAR